VTRSVQEVLLGWAASPLAVERREDTIVLHYHQGRLVRYQLNDFYYTGAMVPIEGSLYAFRGGTAPLPVWKWSGSTVERLPPDEALRIRETFRYASEQIAKEGWSQLDFRSQFPRPPVDRLTIELDGHPLTIRVEAFGRHGLSKRIHVGSTGQETTLVVEAERKWVDRNTYRRMVEGVSTDPPH
jgi:hypothetical protein